MVPDHEDRCVSRDGGRVEAHMVDGAGGEVDGGLERGDEGFVGFAGDEAVHMQGAGGPGAEDVQNAGVFVLGVEVKGVL